MGNSILRQCKMLQLRFLSLWAHLSVVGKALSLLSLFSLITVAIYLLKNPSKPSIELEKRPFAVSQWELKEHYVQQKVESYLASFFKKSAFGVHVCVDSAHTSIVILLSTAVYETTLAEELKQQLKALFSMESLSIYVFPLSKKVTSNVLVSGKQREKQFDSLWILSFFALILASFLIWVFCQKDQEKKPRVAAAIADELMHDAHLRDPP